jgi:HD-GYP domain-containing protein (c-di-GMP phosphodiesterase class II)
VGRKEAIKYEELTTRISAKELSTLLKVSSSLASTMDLAEILQIAIESATGLLGLETGAIYTLENGELYLGATTPPLPAQFSDELRFAKLSDHPHINEVVSTKAPIYLDDARKYPLSSAEKIAVDSRHLISILYFPLLLKEDVIGVFIVGTTDKTRLFAPNEMDLCYILSFQVSLAIANSLLYKKSQQSIVELSRAYEATLEGWSRVLDMRDHITEEHTRRVVELTVALASRMGIPASDLGHIRRGALMHDIGKMGIPDAILQKPGVLSDDEKKIMQTHPEKARDLLARIDYLTPAVDIPYCHHEKWDGSGYPRGLKGEAIPLPARIFAVIDVFDALTSDRPYRKAWKREEALDYIKNQSGKHFYPQAVGAFLEMIEA